MTDLLIAIFIGVVLGFGLGATMFVRHCKNTANTEED
jgi:hypothetical protein